MLGLSALQRAISTTNDGRRAKPIAVKAPREDFPHAVRRSGSVIGWCFITLGTLKTLDITLDAKSEALHLS